MAEVFILNDRKVRLKSMQYKSKADQLEVMRNWFYQNYEDPANACPYESREGGILIYMAVRMTQMRSYRTNLAALLSTISFRSWPANCSKNVMSGRGILPTSIGTMMIYMMLLLPLIIPSINFPVPLSALNLYLTVNLKTKRKTIC